DHGVDGRDRTVTLAEHQLWGGLPSSALGRLDTVLDRKTFDAGAVILRKGDPAQSVYLLMRGQVSVTVDVPGGRIARLSTISPGMAFGELALIDRSARTADARADAPAECRLVSAEVLDRLGDTDPEIKMRILENLLRSVHRMVSRLNHELWTLR